MNGDPVLKGVWSWVKSRFIHTLVPTVTSIACVCVFGTVQRGPVLKGGLEKTNKVLLGVCSVLGADKPVGEGVRV